ncbi:MAG: Inner membrane protein YebZ [Gammaproteobacteria bacterium]|nr:MAG: Inner membrane protein YebZ [Gammaproteobacteria bacterium]
MDIWVLLIPVMRVALYATVVGVLGTFLFLAHFWRYQSDISQAYCSELLRKLATVGVLTSVALFFAISGNMGGTFMSAFSPELLEIAFSSNAGIASILCASGFLLVIGKKKLDRIFPNLVTTLAVSGLLLWTFLASGHAIKLGPLAQVLLLFHLLGIAFWLGSLFPLKHMCEYDDSDRLYEVASNFGKIAVLYLLVLFLAGITFAYLLIGDLSLLVETSYGNLFLAKISIVLVLASLGAYNKYVCVPKIKTDPTNGALYLKKSIRIELVAVALILAITSVLTTSVPLPMGG